MSLVLFILVLFVIQASARQQAAATPSDAQMIYYPSFNSASCNSPKKGLICSGSVTASDGYISLTQAKKKKQVGKLVYHYPVMRQQVFFAIDFTFRILADKSSSGSGYGMAFIMASHNNPLPKHSTGSYIGLMDNSTKGYQVSTSHMENNEQIEKGFSIQDNNRHEKSPSDKYCNDESDQVDTFSDIDDVEIDGYLNNVNEAQYKQIVWEDLNREYLQKQVEKVAAATARAERAAIKAAVAVEKPRKERRLKRTAQAKTAGPAQTDREAARQLPIKKRLSSKLNHDLLTKLFEELEDGQKNPKKSKTDNDEERELDEQQDPTVEENYYDYRDEEGDDVNNFNNGYTYDDLDEVW